MSNLSHFLSATFLFRDFSEEEIDALLPDLIYRTQTYPRGAVVMSEDTGIRQLGFVMSGECEVIQNRVGNAPLPINCLLPPSAFGILTIFAPEMPFPTVVRAKRRCEILFIEEPALLSLLEREPRAAIAVSYFLGNRVGFLNREIATIGAGSADARLAVYLADAYCRYGATFPFSCAEVSRLLNIGRASLYRALDRLAADGVLRTEKRMITILEPKKLERIQS